MSQRQPSAAASILTAGDLDAPVVAALQASVLPARETWREADIAALIRDGAGLVRLGVGRAYGEVMPQGFALARVAGDEAELLSLGVMPGARRLGLGRRLLDAVTDVAVQRGAGALFLEVAEDNAAACALYDAAGFRRVGRRAAYYVRASGDPAAALILRRGLAADSGVFCDERRRG